MIRTIGWLEKQYHPKIIVMASNTPSIQVLDEVKSHFSIPIIGVYPPIKEAISKTKTKRIAILATKGAIESLEIKSFLEKEIGNSMVGVKLVNASDLVDLVEPGTFLTDKSKTKKVVKSVIDNILKTSPDIDIMTLSSTHLPFLKDFLVEMYPKITFLDPAEAVVSQVRELLKGVSYDGKGLVTVVSTVDEERNFTVEGLKKIFEQLGLRVNIKPVEIN